MNQTPTKKRPTTDEILQRIMTIAGEHFPKMPVMITTDRRGRFEAGWVLHREKPSPMGSVSMPLASRQRNHQALAGCILALADHPKADPALFTRSDLFPLSIELRLAFPPAD